MVAVLAVHDKDASDPLFMQWLRLAKDASTDERNFVKKAVNWALRQIGKRNLRLMGLLSAPQKQFRNWIRAQPAGLRPTPSKN